MQAKITPETFTYVERATADLYSIQIRKGRFKNVIYTYGKVSLNENKELDNLSVDFKFTVEEGNNRYSKEELSESKKFKNFLGDILVYILDEEFGNNDEHTTTDIKEDM